MEMKKCEECGKELNLFKGYCHLTLGKNHLLCKSCFDVMDESLTKWRQFVLPYTEFFKNRSSYESLQLNQKNNTNWSWSNQEKFW
jgi:hypothetical protein